MTVFPTLTVIDFCLVKQLSCDWETNFCTLRTEWASLASLTQRQGRAGRVSNGRCYRLISREFLSKHIISYSVPEMQVSKVRCGEAAGVYVVGGGWGGGQERTEKRKRGGWGEIESRERMGSWRKKREVRK